MEIWAHSEWRYMNILVCAATQAELVSYGTSKHKVYYCLHGPGSAQAAHRLTKFLFFHPKPELMIQLGIAGAFNPSLAIGDLVEVIEDRFADLGVTDHDGSFIPFSSLPFTDVGNPFESSILSAGFTLKDFPFTKVKSNTVQTGSGHPELISKLYGRFPADIESMEGAAFFAVAHSEKIPSLQLRSISNRVESRNTTNWDIPLAIKSLRKGLQLVLERL
jgi:futalosine hydrolase